MRGSLSPETIIRNELQAVGCTPRQFCGITGFSYGNFAAIMAGSRDFEPDQAERLREKIEQMKSLVEEIGLIPDWSRTEDIIRVLTLRLVQSVSREQGGSSKKIDEATQQATEALK